MALENNIVKYRNNARKKPVKGIFKTLSNINNGVFFSRNYLAAKKH